ncbi:MAG: shikimate dehydrogenase [Lachnospiraceae bacterium]|jgi:shikimate dehydrogenase|nr:shikimate dehydrogenase [Lachnospiraceae bacterium]
MVETNRSESVLIDGTTQVYGLIGQPVDHTLSPFIHNRLAQMMGINMTYVPFPTTAGAVLEAVAGAHALGIRGMNVTVPYKSEVMAGLKQVEKTASGIGAVNTLVRGEDGFVGYNTDVLGLYRAMTEENIRIQDEAVIVLGAGGAARAAAFMCGVNGAATITIMNRSAQKAVELAVEVDRAAGRHCAVGMAIADRVLLPAQKYLAIQATSVGLGRHSEEAVITDPSFYSLVHTGYELIYQPDNTLFMQLVRAAGGRAYNGLKMLLYQAVQAFELWHQITVPEAFIGTVYQELIAVLGKR